MATFTKNELGLFEELFHLDNGHVLNMSRKDFGKFIYRSIDIDITSESYEKKVKKHRKYFSMKQIYRYIVECENKNKSIKFLNDLIHYIDDNNLKNIDGDLLIKAKTILKNKSDEFSAFESDENEYEELSEHTRQMVEQEMSYPAYGNGNEPIKIPFPAYIGDEHYMFISYAHKDKKVVYQEIKRFHDEGYNIWYDKGITPGEDWNDAIANALTDSSLVIAFMSKNSIKSPDFKNEIRFALNKNIDVVPIYLDEIQLPPGLEMDLSRKHAIFKNRISDEDYFRECLKAFKNANLLKHKKNKLSFKEYDDDSFEGVVLPGCNKKEKLIFIELCEFCLDKSFDAEIDPPTILDLISKYYEDENSEKLTDKIRYSLKNLEKNNYITSEGSSLGFGFSTSSITYHGFCFYLKNFFKDKTIYPNVIHAIFLDELSTIEIISKKYNILPSIVEMLIKLFRKEGHIVCNNNLTEICITPSGEEYFENILNEKS